MFRKHLGSGLSVVLMAMVSLGLLHAWGVPGPGSDRESHVIFRATGSTANQANPTCNGKANSSCSGNAPVKEFDLSLGSTGPLYPGLANTLPATFTNPQSFDIKVMTLSVTAERAALNTDCSVSNLNFPAGVTNLSPALVVPRKASASTTITVGMKPSAGEECQNAGFVITMTATAVKN